MLPAPTAATNVGVGGTGGTVAPAGSTRHSCGHSGQDNSRSSGCGASNSGCGDSSIGVGSGDVTNTVAPDLFRGGSLHGLCAVTRTQ